MQALLFPGQGSQFVGMGKDLHEQYEEARRIFEAADEALGFPLSQVMFAGPEETLRETRNAQPAILVHSLAVWKVLNLDTADGDWVAAGHSLGEYSAYAAAGALSFEDAVRLVRRRGELMFAAGEERPGTMAAVLGMAAEAVTEVCAAIDGIVQPANLNSPGQVVISGEIEAVRKAGEQLKAQGAKRVVELSVSGAFHSPLMEAAAGGLSKALSGVAIEPARFPVFANVSAEPVTAPDEVRESLERQLMSPVLWEPSMRGIGAQQPEGFLEIGPGQVLRGLLRQIDRSRSCRTLGTADEVQAFKEGS
jgi:[acyl-carrier-protein] S-malonyltransferase